MALTNENGGATVTQTNVFINPQQFSAQTGHHPMIIDEYANGDGIHINYIASIKFLLVKIGLDPT
jgi:hypothetical protein